MMRVYEIKEVQTTTSHDDTDLSVIPYLTCATLELAKVLADELWRVMTRVHHDELLSSDRARRTMTFVSARNDDTVSVLGIVIEETMVEVGDRTIRWYHDGVAAPTEP